MLPRCSPDGGDGGYDVTDAENEDYTRDQRESVALAVDTPPHRARGVIDVLIGHAFSIGPTRPSSAIMGNTR